MSGWPQLTLADIDNCLSLIGEQAVPYPIKVYTHPCNMPLMAERSQFVTIEYDANSPRDSAIVIMSNGNTEVIIFHVTEPTSIPLFNAVYLTTEAG